MKNLFFACLACVVFICCNEPAPQSTTGNTVDSVGNTPGALHHETLDTTQSHDMHDTTHQH